MSNKSDIINLLSKYPNGLKARQIATHLCADRKEINQILYSNLNDFVIDGTYVWKLKNQKQSQTIQKKETKIEYKIGDSVVGLKITHDRFGVGVITEQDEKYISVQFAAKTATFSYPDAFEFFIKAEDAKIQAAIIKAINAAKEAAAQRIEAALAEWHAAEEARKAEEAKKAAEKAQRRVANAGSYPVTKIARNFNELVAPDYHAEKLARQPVLTYQQVENEFGIRIAGFGRGINPTNKTVVLISSIGRSNGKFVYHDRWTADGDYLYSGEGKTGNQTMTKGNAAIRDAKYDGKKIHLFVP